MPSLFPSSHVSPLTAAMLWLWLGYAFTTLWLRSDNTCVRFWSWFDATMDCPAYSHRVDPPPRNTICYHAHCLLFRDGISPLLHHRKKTSSNLKSVALNNPLSILLPVRGLQTAGWRAGPSDSSACPVSYARPSSSTRTVIHKPHRPINDRDHTRPENHSCQYNATNPLDAAPVWRRGRFNSGMKGGPGWRSYRRGNTATWALTRQPPRCAIGLLRRQR